MTKLFYLAASWEDRLDMRMLAEEVQELTGGRWLTSSRWLYGDPQTDYKLAANMDLIDITSANAFVMNLAPSVSRGKYTELGYAIAHDKPIFLFGTGKESMEDSVFFHLRELVTWAPPRAGAREIAHYLTMEEKISTTEERQIGIFKPEEKQ